MAINIERLAKLLFHVQQDPRAAAKYISENAGSGSVGPQGPAGPKGDPGEKGEKGDKGDQGVSITNVSGSIDGENNITLTFTLSEGEPITVTGKITPPAAG